MNLIYQSIGDISKTIELAELLSKEYKKIKVIILSGDLGAGKTTFTSFLLKAIGLVEVINSPTFTILKQYKYNNYTFNHFDFYRLNEDSSDFDFIDLLNKEKTLSLIEWYDNFPIELPKENILIKIKKISIKKREISVYSSFMDTL